MGVSVRFSEDGRGPDDCAWPRGADMPAASPEEIHTRIASAFNDRDFDAFAELHEERAMALIPPDGRRVSGRDAVVAATALAIAHMHTFDIEVVDKLQVDDLALTHARWRALAVDGGETVPVQGRGTVVSRRQLDGTWRIVIDNPMSPD